jgi:hypothetical protein|tara:strand:+ start:656 stop:778 length:123 start_codon:yes stop_codon:yes gene_type:complete
MPGRKKARAKKMMGMSKPTTRSQSSAKMVAAKKKKKNGKG